MPPLKPAERAALLSDPDLGNVADRIIGERYGITRAAVCLIRKQMGVLPEKGARTRKMMADPDIGRVSDSIIADRYGTDARYVCRIRKKHGIKTSWPKKQGGPVVVLAPLSLSADVAVALKEKVKTQKTSIAAYLRLLISADLGLEKP